MIKFSAIYIICCQILKHVLLGRQFAYPRSLVCEVLLLQRIRHYSFLVAESITVIEDLCADKQGTHRVSGELGQLVGHPKVGSTLERDLV